MTALLLLALIGHPQSAPASHQASKPSQSATTQAAGALASARELYNQGKYDEAIAAAATAREVPASANAAAVVFARAHLERYRRSAEPEDLVAARTALIQVVDAALSPREHAEAVVGLGECVYFDGQFGTAAEFFDGALARSEQLEPDARPLLFEWWANASSQQAEFGPEPERRAIYARILARAEDELRRDDRSPTASYWLAAAARGANQLDRAWSAALAGWVRAPLTGSRGVTLRNDLDRFVTLVLIPERARQLAASGDSKDSVAALAQQWEEFKQKYGSVFPTPGLRVSEPAYRAN